MNKSDLKNIVFLKNVNSNIVDEAIMILKPNVKVKEFIVEGNIKKEDKNGDYILNEAQMVVSNYISNMKNEDKQSNKKYEKKFKNLKLINVGLTLIVVCLIVLNVL